MARSSVKREFLIPKNADKIEDEESGAVVYLYTAKPGQPAAMGWRRWVEVSFYANASERGVERCLIQCENWD